MGEEREGMPPGGESGAAGGTRSQNMVVMGAMEPRTVQAALRPGVERSRAGGAPSAPTCLVITPSTLATQLAAREARALLGSPTLRVVPVTDPKRAKRVLAHSAVAIAVGTAEHLNALRRASAISFDQLQAVVLLGLDTLLTDGSVDHIESLLSDIPGTTARVASSASDHDAKASGFLNRHLPKARHITPLVKTTQVTFGLTPQYHIIAPAARAAALSTFLDERDPPSLAVVVQSDVAEAEAKEALETLGLLADHRVVQVVRGTPLGHTAAVVGWSVPVSSDALEQALAGQPIEAVFFIQPTDLPLMTAVSGGAARPLTLGSAVAEAARGADAIHAALRGALTDGQTIGAADLALVAPLLDEFDPVQVAAAALRLFDNARRTLAQAHGQAAAARAVFASPARPAAEATSARAGDTGTTRLFFNVGKRDNVRPGDLLGAIAGESGLPGDRIGSIDLFESHTLVEIASESVDIVIERLTGVTLRGRQLHVRRDDRSGGGHAGFGGARGGARGAPARGGPSRGGAPRGGGRGNERSGDRGFGGARGRGPERERGGDRGASRGGKPWEERSPRSVRPDAARREFGDRSPSERTEPRGEWAGRGEQLSRSRGARPEAGRPAADRTDRPALPFRRRSESPEE